MRRLNIGWFSFTCSEDSTIIFSELLNTRFKKWRRRFNFKHARFFQTKNIMEPFDIAFIEGAISSARQAKRAKKIRKLAKKVVAIGSCACIGMPASQRNNFSKNQLKEIQFLLDRFEYSDKVRRLDEVIKVDYKVSGCPMSEKLFLQTIDKLLKELDA